MGSCPVFSQVLPFFLDVLTDQHIELSVMTLFMVL